MHIAVYSTFYVVWVRWHLLSYLCSAITIQLFRLCAVMNLCSASSAYCEAVSRKCADTSGVAWGVRGVRTAQGGQLNGGGQYYNCITFLCFFCCCKIGRASCRERV